MSSQDTDLRGLNDAFWNAVSARPDKVTGRDVIIPPMIPTAKVSDESRLSRTFPVLEHMGNAMEIARTEASEPDIIAALERVATMINLLDWSQNASYNETNCTPEFLTGYAYAGISGPEGPLVCAAPRGGLMIMGPHVTYPAHNHAPKEIYLVLTPGTQWQLDEGDWFEVTPGDLIFHDNWQMHAMKTTSQPLLAFAGWIESGDRRAIGWSKPSA